jgi:hypothetical protein
MTSKKKVTGMHTVHGAYLWHGGNHVALVDWCKLQGAAQLLPVKPSQ